MTQPETTDAPAGERPTAPPPPLGPRFAHLFTFSALSNLADGLIYVGVPLFALTLTTSPGLVSLVTTAITIPWLLFALVAGVVIDRHDRVRILVIASLMRIAVFLGAALAAANDLLTMPLLLGLLVVLGTAEVFADGASSALVPDVTPRTRLGAANSRLMGAQLVANSFLGAPLAGFVLAAGAGWLFGVPAGLVAAGVLVTLRGLWGKVRHGQGSSGAPSAEAPSSADRSVRRELREGLTFLWGHAVIRPIVLGGMSYNFLSNAYMAVFVVWVVGPASAVGLAPEQYGLLAMGLAAGGLAGAVLAERIIGQGRERLVVAVTWGVCAVLLAVPALVPQVWSVAVAFTLIGFFNIVGNTATSALRQRLVPSAILGRVQGAAATLGFGSMPLGAALGGIVAELFGVRTLLLAVAVATVLVVVLTVRALPQHVIDAAERAEEQRLAAREEKQRLAALDEEQRLAARDEDAQRA